MIPQNKIAQTATILKCVQDTPDGSNGFIHFMQESLFEIPQLNEAPNPPLQQCSVRSGLVLYHGTNRRIANLRCESFLSEDAEDAVFFAQLKNGGTVYKFIVDANDVYRDVLTPQKRWYLSRKKLKPVRVWSV